MKQPLKAVDALLQSVEKQFGKGAMMRLGDGDLPATTTRRLQCDMILRGSTRPPHHSTH